MIDDEGSLNHKKSTMSLCGVILKSGKNKGGTCSNVVSYKYEGKYFCGVHCSKKKEGRIDISYDNAAMLDDVSCVFKNSIYKKFYRENADINCINKDRETCLMGAARNCDPNAVKVLCEKGADISRTDRHGDTALIFAARYGDLSIVKFLCEQGADHTHTNNDGRTALDIARKNKHDDIVNFLVEYEQAAYAASMIAAYYCYLWSVTTSVKKYNF